MPPSPNHPNIEVRAGAVHLFLAAFDVFPSLAQRYLVRRGFAETIVGDKLQPTKGFLPLDAWLETFDAVLADIGPNALFKIGQRITGNPHFPGTVTDLESAFRVADQAYHMSHRKDGRPMFDAAKGKMLEGIGNYKVERDGKAKKILVECDTPYPCPLEHGMVSGIAWHFDARAIVAHEDPQRCRMKGSDRCRYVVTW
jgi:hypothetical protein